MLDTLIDIPSFWFFIMKYIYRPTPIRVTGVSSLVISARTKKSQNSFILFVSRK
jgi:hypothetical protein